MSKKKKPKKFMKWEFASSPLTTWTSVTSTPDFAPEPEPIPFKDVVDELVYRISDMMVERHEKYGPDNINRHGMLGVRVRLDDKLARIDNGDADFEDESYRDCWVDVVGYGLIALLLIDKKWPGQTP